MPPTFNQCLAYSDSPVVSQYAGQLLATHLPDVQLVIRADMDDDRHGVDYWVTLGNGRRVAVDLKARRTWPGWVFLETWSVVEERVPGWTLRTDKLTDLVLWVWAEQRRFALVPFRRLQAAFRAHELEWVNKYPVRVQSTPARYGRPAYHSQCVMVPVREMMKAVAQPALAA